MRIFAWALLVMAGVAGCRMKEHKPLIYADSSQKTVSPGKHVVARNDAETATDPATLTTIQWLDSTHADFGKIAEGRQLEVVYHFRNSGDKPLVISKVEVSCGCTVAEQPKEPVAPNKTGIIRAVFNSDRRIGINHKTLFVIANTKGSGDTELQFTVEVVKKKW